MSFVHILAADTPLPLCDCSSVRTLALSDQISVTAPFGFSLRPCTYYPHEMAHCHTKACQYAMELVQDGQTLANLRAYLRASLSPGSSVELWHIWLDGAPLRPAPPRYRGTLAGPDEEAFSQLSDRRNLTCMRKEAHSCPAIESAVSTKRSSGSWPASSAA